MTALNHWYLEDNHEKTLARNGWYMQPKVGEQQYIIEQNFARDISTW